ncbi:hypothetical protein [Arsukibacterium indicum]|uniref:Uncharacterized protein n=1 Tax=Arsukibacterium indicum TaxID=2848612 RepID=A0ABS6MP61_9GAMM|nr:hypothetical protein [Arsukibacterium indicum]MBV2130597.1 hypothetical protein [Arsukibacterium indicum]
MNKNHVNMKKYHFLSSIKSPILSCIIGRPDVYIGMREQKIFQLGQTSKEDGNDE